MLKAETAYVYEIHTKFGHVDIVVPFICQKCGTCCRELSVYGFGRPCRYLDLKTNLCIVYDKRPDECRGFPFKVDCGVGEALVIGCPAIQRFRKMRGSLLVGYSCFSGGTSRKWVKPPDCVYQLFLKKLLKMNPTEQELSEFERLNKRGAS